MMYDVQIKVNGEWRWASVKPKGGPRYETQRQQMLKMARDPFWTNHVRATHFRVRLVPGSGTPAKGPRAIAREALALAEKAEARCAKLLAERDEARMYAEQYASLQGLEIDWE